MDKPSKHEIKLEYIINEIANALNIEHTDLDIETNSSDLDEWDSIGTLNIITHLEEKYDQKFELMEIPLFNNVKSILHLLGNKGMQIVE